MGEGPRGRANFNHAAARINVSGTTIAAGKFTRTGALAACLMGAFPNMSKADFARVKTPALVACGSKDTLASPEGAQEMFSRISSPDKRFELLDGLYHEVLNEPEREEVLDLVCAWIAAHNSSK